MADLVAALVELAQDSGTPAILLLQRARVVAARLNLDATWIQNELLGYATSEGMPSYRIVKCEYGIVTAGVFAPIRWGDYKQMKKEVLELLGTGRLLVPAAQLEALIETALNDKSPGQKYFMSPAPDQEKHAFDEHNRGFAQLDVRRRFTYEAMRAVVFAIKHRVFEWALDLAQTSRTVEVSTAPPEIIHMTFNLEGNNNTVSNVVNSARATVATASGSAIINAALSRLGPTEAATGIDKLRNAITASEDLDDDQKKQALELLGEVATEAAKPTAEKKPHVARALWSQMREAISLSADVLGIYAAVAQPILALF
ncbi:MAG: hypothetical protein QM817_40865 [Archangium sp.]